MLYVSIYSMYLWNPNNQIFPWPAWGIRNPARPHASPLGGTPRYHLSRTVSVVEKESMGWSGRQLMISPNPGRWLFKVKVKAHLGIYTILVADSYFHLQHVCTLKKHWGGQKKWNNRNTSYPRKPWSGKGHLIVYKNSHMLGYGFETIQTTSGL